MTSEARRVTVELENFSADLIKRITLDATANLIEDTPIDLGWARSNWVPNIGEPFEKTVGTQEAADAGNINRSIQQEGVARVLTEYRLTMGPVYITNNVPYINRLNEGHSNQAEAGYVQNALSRAVASAVRS